MSSLDATRPGVAPPHGPVRFGGDRQAFWWLVARGAVLLMLTLGIYRFWLTTDIRRFLWSSTELAGDSFEYTGTARELLLGFLVAIAALVPVNVFIFLLALSTGDVLGLVGLLLLTVLGQYALYRARRYRLTRTVFRGVRFHQTGSAWHYACCAMWWWTLTLLTLGLAYPFAQARLERFKMRHTFFGSLPGRFEASGLQLLLRGALLWFLAVVPSTAGMVATLLAIDWNVLLTASGSDDTLSWLDGSGVASATVLAGLTGAWLLLSLAILYPVFQAILLRWWASGLRFGDVTVTCHLRIGQVVGIYARFAGRALVFTAVMAAVIGAGWLVLERLTGEIDSMLDETVTTLAAVAAYVAAALGYSAIYQATVRLGLWHCVVESLDISGIARLDRVPAAGEPASPVGEGLADALSVGGV
jgi:uncharacterized membrane protein YjgN (DUF898 family)